jgi:probable phosphoglycerate mutase
MAIFLISHGETDGNKHRVVQVPDTPLNEHGRRQASHLAQRLRDEGITRVVASDLARARMTAEAIAAEIGVEVELEPLLQERNFGDLRGRAYASFDRDIMEEGYEPPGGESWEAFHRRAEDAWNGVVAAAERTDGALAIVTHGLVCHSFAVHHLRLSATMEVPERWGNTSLTVIDKAPPWEVRVLNCTSHLGADSADDVLLRSGL